MAHEIRSSDLALARRLEAAEAANALNLARATALFEHRLIAGGCALFAGVGSPLTHALGCGMSGPVTTADVESLEAFFYERGSDCLIDLCPMADTGLTGAVMERGYSVIEFNNVLVRPLAPADAALSSDLPAPEIVDDATRLDWIGVLARSFDMPMEPLENIPVFDETLLVRVGSSVAASVGGWSAAEGVALLFGDATVQEARGRGLQSGLIRERLARAARAGCDLAMACTLPGSASHRNYERLGFSLAYMRVNVRRPQP